MSGFQMLFAEMKSFNVAIQIEFYCKTPFTNITFVGFDMEMNRIHMNFQIFLKAERSITVIAFKGLQRFVNSINMFFQMTF